MVTFVNSGIVHFPHQKVDALEEILISSGHLNNKDHNCAELIRDVARDFLCMYDETAEVWYETVITRDKFKQYFKVAECYANKTGHFELKQVSLFTSVCDYCKTVEFETESYIGCD